MTVELRQEIESSVREKPSARLMRVLTALGIAAASWYRKPREVAQRRRRGPAPRPLPEFVAGWIVAMALANPWYGYRRIAVMCRRAGQSVKDRWAYAVMKANGLLHKRRPRKAEVYQAQKLYELLPRGPNELWQMDVTYWHIPGFGWWYVVTVIDYYSRYLLAAHLTASYCASEIVAALQQARAEAERLRGPPAKIPFLVTDNGPSFGARKFESFIRHQFSHVRIAYRTPTQLGLLERLHGTLKEEVVYWEMAESPAHARSLLAEFRERYNHRRPHWALAPETGGDPLVPSEVYTDGRIIRIPRWQGWAREAKKKIDEALTATTASA